MAEEIKDDLNDEELEEKASKLSDEKLAIGSETTGNALEQVDSSVRAILLKRDGNGAVRIFGDEVRNIMADIASGWLLIIIKPGETARIHGTPVIRNFTQAQ